MRLAKSATDVNDPAWRDRAPYLKHIDGAGDVFVIETPGGGGWGAPQPRGAA